jgi:hypothetical protein
VHLGTLFVGLLGGYIVVKFLFASGTFSASSRMQFETDPFGKLVWFFSQPLSNASALYALRDSFGTGAWIFWPAVAVVVGIIGAAAKLVPDLETKRKWLICVCVLPFAAHAVSFAAAERSIGYRVLFALSALVLVLLVFTFRLAREQQRIHRKLAYAGLGALMIIAAVSANRHALKLIAEPQGHEWGLIQSAVKRHTFKAATKVYIITPTLDDRSTERVFMDEFGSLTSDSDWAPREMFKVAMFDRYGATLPKGVGYEVTLGRKPPGDDQFDLVVDMRRLREFRK